MMNFVLKCHVLICDCPVRSSLVHKKGHQAQQRTALSASDIV